MSNESIAKCDVCQRWVKRSTLRLMAHDLLQLASANYLLWSEFNTSGDDPYWAIDTATQLADISLGTNGDARPSYGWSGSPDTITYLNCSTTFLGSGTARTLVAVDVTGWTRVCFWANVGMHERDTHQSCTVAMGTCDTDGANQQEWYTYTGIGRHQRWFSVPSSSITAVALDAVCFYITVTTSTASCWWWFDQAAVNDLVRPDIFVPTRGAAVSYATDASIRTVAKTCPACREKVFKKSEARGRPNIEHDPPISRDVWEG